MTTIRWMKVLSNGKVKKEKPGKGSEIIYLVRAKKISDEYVLKPGKSDYGEDRLNTHVNYFSNEPISQISIYWSFCHTSDLLEDTILDEFNKHHKGISLNSMETEDSLGFLSELIKYLGLDLSSEGEYYTGLSKLDAEKLTRIFKKHVISN